MQKVPLTNQREPFENGRFAKVGVKTKESIQLNCYFYYTVSFLEPKGRRSSSAPTAPVESGSV